jgi:hypothetical protein
VDEIARRFEAFRPRCAAGTGHAQPPPMLDLVFLAATAGFFLLGLAYVRGCDRL